MAGGYTEFGITSATSLSKFIGLWWPRNAVEERQQRISAIYTAAALLYGEYLNTTDLYYTWDDTSHRMYVILNVACLTVTIVKLLILHTKRADLGDIVQYAEQYFWHSNYNPEEQMLLSLCAKHCSWFMIFILVALPSALTSYIITPIVVNRGRNMTDRVLPFKMWVDWPVTETPYYEIIYTIQTLSVYIIGAAYVGTDMLLCVFNLHVVCQLRILQCRMLKFWNTNLAVMNDIIYSDYCYAGLKKCVRYHQMLTIFCEKLENMYSMIILIHVAVLSALLGFDSYGILVADIESSMSLLFLFHGIGSLGHLFTLTYTCHCIMEESMNITTAIYLGSWSTLPVNQVGNSIRSAMKFIMMRSLRPCYLTAGGFFPVTLETFTKIISTTFSYFTLMREA